MSEVIRAWKRVQCWKHGSGDELGGHVRIVDVSSSSIRVATFNVGGRICSMELRTEAKWNWKSLPPHVIRHSLDVAWTREWMTPKQATSLAFVRRFSNESSIRHTSLFLLRHGNLDIPFIQDDVIPLFQLRTLASIEVFLNNWSSTS